MDSSHIVYFILSLLVMFIAYNNGKRLSILNKTKISAFSPVIIAYTDNITQMIPPVSLK